MTPTFSIHPASGARPPRPHVALVVGSTGAGKSTFTRTLLDELAAVPFVIDEWVATLYGDDKPDDAGYDWYMPRIQRIETEMRRIAAAVLGAGAAVVLDLGFTERSHRASWIDWARGLGVAPWIYYLDIDADERWRRVQQRNDERGPTFQLEVTREMFDFMEARFEPPADDEAPLILVR
jgi:predicted kinase